MADESNSDYESGLFATLQTDPPDSVIKSAEINRILECLPLNPFAVLQLSYHPSPEEIESQHKKKTDLVHPDKTPLYGAARAYDLLNKSKSDLTNTSIRDRLDQLYIMACKQKLGEEHEGPVLRLEDFLSVQTRFEAILEDEESQRDEEFRAEISKQKKRFKSSEWKESHPDFQYKPAYYKNKINKNRKSVVPYKGKAKLDKNNYFSNNPSDSRKQNNY